VLKDKAPVFVFNCHFNGLALIQELGRKGIPVYALDTNRSIGTRSKYAEYIKVTDPLINENEFIEQLIELAKKTNNKPLLLPTNDQWSEAISRHKVRLSEFCVVSGSDISAIELILDKERFASWCSDNEYPVPKVFDIEAVLSGETIINYPVALKANSRRKSGLNESGAAWAKTADKLRFNICNSEEDIRKLNELAKKNGVPIYLQELVSGRSNAMRTIGVFANKGKVKGIIYGHKLRGFPAQHGDCIVGEAYPVPDWARELVVSMCEKLEYTGIAEFELMQDSVTKENLIIEINPRSWSWVGIGPACGVSLGWLAYKELVHGEDQQAITESCADGQPVIFTKILEDLLNTLIFYRLEGTKDWSGGPIKWWGKYKNKKIVYAGYSWDEPRVAFYTTLLGFKRFLSGIKQLVKK